MQKLRRKKAEKGGCGGMDMTHDQWLAERRKSIGGSDAAAIVGLSPYKSAFDVYADKLDLIPPTEDNEAMRQGRDLEEYVARRFCKATDKRVRRCRSMIRNQIYPFAHANVDRLIVGEKAGLECKTTSSMNLRRYKNGEYPSEYYCQCMHYMAVTGYSKWYLAVLIYGKEFKVFEIERDEEEIDALMNAERDFWENHVLAKQPPIPSGTDDENETIGAFYPQADRDRDTVNLISSEALFARRAEINALLDKLMQEKQQIDQQIKLQIGEAPRAVCGNWRVTWRNAARQTLDTKRLIRDYFPNTDLSEYMNTTNYRVFKIMEVE